LCMYVLIPVYYAASCGEYNPKRDLKITSLGCTVKLK